ncbi:MAG: penicillin-binding protein [Clostridia bacterium]|nr:penicillin-binding protein [Clostridia bacterium]
MPSRKYSPSHSRPSAHKSRPVHDPVRLELFRRVRGKPSHAGGMMSIPRTFGVALGRVIELGLISLIIMGFLLAGIGGGMLVGYITTAEPISAGMLSNTTETTHIKDSESNDIAILTGSQNINREYVSFSAIKKTYIDEAFKAIEDERYDEHIGIDPRRIGSAIVSALANSGTATHGGSTITQQTVKMISGADQRSAQRKIQEWYNAIQLEQQRSKDEIMELYLNLVPMGNSYVGVQSAAKAYFDKDAKDLSLIECAFLAGIPNLPAVYNPLTETGRRNALRRMRIVLSKMHDLGWITLQEYDDALNQELVFRETPMAVSSNQVNSYFVDYVIEQVIADLVSERGYSREVASVAVYNHGLTIETTVDSSVQAKAEKVFNTQSLFMQDPSILDRLPESPQASTVVIENYPNPGQIKAIVGGYGEKTGNFILNRAVSSQRQPGSSIKPLAVYGPAIDTGKITAASIIADIPVYLNPDEPDKLYPKNSYSGYRGNLTVREAIKISCNTVAAQIWQYMLKGETSLKYLAAVGIDRSTENYVAIALGAFNQGMTALEMAGGYATLANEGLYTEPYAYTRVLDANGNVLLEHRPEFTQVYKPETAFVMTDLMQGVFQPGGTAAGRGPTNTLAAGKTGTTDDNRDKWFCGFTPYYTAAVWYGYDNQLGGTTIPQQDRSNAILIWQAMMQSLHQTLPARDFPAQKNVLALTVCPESGQLATVTCPAPYTEYFVPGMALNPSQPCPVHTGGAPVMDPANPETPAIPGETIAPEAIQPAETTPAP